MDVETRTRAGLNEAAGLEGIIALENRRDAERSLAAEFTDRRQGITRSQST
jgi:hypothetical protein